MKVRHAFGADSGKLLQTMVAGWVVLASPVLVNGQESLFIEDFASGVGAMTAGVECGSGSQWLGDTFCTANPLGSGPAWARFGVGFDGCTDYSDGNVTAYMTTPELDT